MGMYLVVARLVSETTERGAVIWYVLAMLGQRSEVYFVVYKYKTHLRKCFKYKNHLLQMNRVGVGVFGLFLANE